MIDMTAAIQLVKETRECNSKFKYGILSVDNQILHRQDLFFVSTMFCIKIYTLEDVIAVERELSIDEFGWYYTNAGKDSQIDAEKVISLFEPEYTEVVEMTDLVLRRGTDYAVGASKSGYSFVNSKLLSIVEHPYTPYTFRRSPKNHAVVATGNSQTVRAVFASLKADCPWLKEIQE